MIDIGAVASAAAIASPILILLTFKWNSMDSVSDRESILRDRLDKVKTTAGGFVVQVTGIRANEDNSRRSKFKKFFLFRLSGYTRVELFILKKQVPGEELWDNPLFDEFCDSQDFDVEHVSTNTGSTDSTGVIFRVHSLDPDIVEDFAKTVPEYLRILAEQGWLQPSGPQAQLDQLDRNELPNDAFSNLED